jgi:hypothetical protein
MSQVKIRPRREINRRSSDGFARALGSQSPRHEPLIRLGGGVAYELSAWAVGGGIITVALFPLALPILALTALAVLPFVLIPLAVGVAALLVVLPILAIRNLVRWAHTAADTDRPNRGRLALTLH